MYKKNEPDNWKRSIRSEFFYPAAPRRRFTSRRFVSISGVDPLSDYQSVSVRISERHGKMAIVRMGNWSWRPSAISQWEDNLTELSNNYEQQKQQERRLYFENKKHPNAWCIVCTYIDTFLSFHVQDVSHCWWSLSLSLSSKCFELVVYSVRKRCCQKKETEERKIFSAFSIYFDGKPTPLGTNPVFQQ